MKNFLFLAVGIMVIAGSFYLFLQKPAPAKYQTYDRQPTADSRLMIGERDIKVEIADTEEERSKGLSGRESLPEGTGMLFIFEKPGQHGFWMKDMKFPIDIVWLDENFKVVSIERNVNPITFPRIFYPPVPIKYVVEVNIGEL